MVIAYTLGVLRPSPRDREDCTKDSYFLQLLTIGFGRKYGGTISIIKNVSTSSDFYTYRISWEIDISPSNQGDMEKVETGSVDISEMIKFLESGEISFPHQELENFKVCKTVSHFNKTVTELIFHSYEISNTMRLWDYPYHEFRGSLISEMSDIERDYYLELTKKYPCISEFIKFGFQYPF